MNYFLNRKEWAFTLAELMIVVVIIGIIAAFGIPAYTTLVDRSHERTAVLSLKTIHAGQELFKVRNGEYFPDPGGLGNQGIGVLNPALGLKIVEPDNLRYGCWRSAGAGTPYECYAQKLNPGVGVLWTLQINPGGFDIGNPCCKYNTDCPTVKTQCS